MRIARTVLVAAELAILTALILATRFANYPDVFVGGKIYFSDADCYGRMTRVRLCAQHSGLILRHHFFENFPAGTTPHTTAPLDYLILAISLPLRPLAPNHIDLAGALCSPLIALLGAWFFWWWSRQMRLRFRWVLLLLFALSPIIVHATELGRPDHQSLAVVLVMVAVCAEWSWWQRRSAGWSVTAGAGWALAIWISAYEPLILFLAFIAALALTDPATLIERSRRTGWIVFFGLIMLALLIERRMPSITGLSDVVERNWLGTIGELRPVALINRIWLQWAGYLILLIPVLVWLGYRRRTRPPPFVLLLLLLTFLLTIWQARWGYFFAGLFALTLAGVIESIASPAAIWIAFALSLWPVLDEWDKRMWPNEVELVRRVSQRREAVELRAMAVNMISSDRHGFLAPWWLSPPIAYWSGQPGVAGSSHEGFAGIRASAAFFLTSAPSSGRDILAENGVDWVLVCDSDGLVANSAAILGVQPPARPLGLTLDRTATQAPSFLTLVAENQTAKLFRVGNNR